MSSDLQTYFLRKNAIPFDQGLPVEGKQRQQLGEAFRRCRRPGISDVNIEKDGRFEHRGAAPGSTHERGQAARKNAEVLAAAARTAG